MSARRLLLLAAAALSVACSKPEPDHPIQRVEMSVVTTPPIAATVPAVVRPGDTTSSVQLTSGIAVAIKMEVFQDAVAVAARVSESDRTVFQILPREGGYVLVGGTPGTARVIITADKAAAPMSLTVTVKDQ